MDKSFVSMEQALCPVCGAKHDTGSLLMDRRLQPSLDRATVTHWALCVEHRRLEQEGYIALIECNNTSPPTLDTADRTGQVAHIRRSVWSRVFNMPEPEGPIAFVQPGVIAALQKKP